MPYLSIELLVDNVLIQPPRSPKQSLHSLRSLRDCLSDRYPFGVSMGDRVIQTITSMQEILRKQYTKDRMKSYPENISFPPSNGGVFPALKW